MIPTECKRLAEVDFPIALVSRHAAKEKTIRHGHPSTLHLWWARRPLASCRAMLLGLLWPDPCDPHCPQAFKEQARRLLPQIPNCNPGVTDEDLRMALLRFIGDFADWKLAANSTYLSVSRALVKIANGEEPPLVVDPFAGGGSIPLEALRLGCEAFASDLNPVACLILKVMLEDIPRRGPGLAEDLRQVGDEIKEKAQQELKDFYPDDPDGAKPIAYLWARTVRCEAPNCGAEIPLIRSFWLGRKPKRKRALQHHVERSDGMPPRVRFEIFEPRSDGEVANGTVVRAKATCLCCGSVLPPERVREQLTVQRGGADVLFDEKGNRISGARMTAVVTLRPGETGRHYRLPSERDYDAVKKAQEQIAEILREWERIGNQGLCPVPSEPTPTGGGSGAGRAFSVQRYGMFQWGDLFTARQKMTLAMFASVIGQYKDLDRELALVVSKMSDLENALCGWRASSECVDHLFARQAIPIVWDFAEASPLAGATGSWESMLNRSKEGGLSSYSEQIGQVQQNNATDHPLPDESAGVWFTDPPYYDAIPYSDLSDFFLVWLKRALPEYPLLRDPFNPDNPLSPKAAEAVQDETRQADGQPKDREWFEGKMAKAFAEGRRVLREDGIGSVVFAHKTTEGWEALLSGMIRGGWTITGSWPIATEMGARLRARESAALATSIHLVCRPRSENAPIGDWADVLRELPSRVADWMERLQDEGIRGADLIFACIGPALEIFSRYTHVETAEGQQVGLAEYLEKVWEVVGRTALENVLGTAESKARNGLTGALEEDARLTALFLWALQSTNSNTTSNSHDSSTEEETSQSKSKGYSLIFDVVRRFAQPLGIDLPKWEDRIIETSKGVVRLMAVTERGKQLFGKDEAQAMSTRMELEISSDPNPYQGILFPDLESEAFAGVREPQVGYGEILRGNQTSGGRLDTHDHATTLDRIHAAMLLQVSGHSQTLRNLLKTEQERGPDFLRLANALSALYPVSSEEKRLLDAMLLAVPG